MLIRSLSVFALSLCLGACASAPLPPGGSIVSGMNNRTWGAVAADPAAKERPRSDQVVILGKKAATPRQIATATKRSTNYFARLTPAEREFIAASGARYLCVFTPPERGHQGEKSVMFWDTQQQTLVGNSVYEINNAPPDNVRVQLPDFVVLHIGNGV